MGASARKALTPPSDADVIARARKGDHDAFRVLVERYQERAYGLALRVLRDQEWAEDVVQEAFLKVYRSLDRFEGRSSFYTWLYRIVMNLCLDAKRSDRSNRHVEWDEATTFEADPGSADAVSAVHQELVGPERGAEVAVGEPGRPVDGADDQAVEPELDPSDLGADVDLHRLGAGDQAEQQGDELDHPRRPIEIGRRRYDDSLASSSRTTTAIF